MQSLAELVLSNAALATILALVAAIAGRFCRRPQVIYALWLLVLLKLATPPLFRIPIALLPMLDDGESIAEDFLQGVEPQLVSAVDTVPDGHQPNWGFAQTSPPIHDHETDATRQQQLALPTEAERQTVAFRADDRHVAGNPMDMSTAHSSNVHATSPESSPRSNSQVPWSAFVLGVWALGAVIWLSLVLTRLVRFRRAVGGRWPIDSELQRCADELSLRMGLRRAPVVRLVDAIVPPLLWAIGRPAEVLLPRPLLARLSPDQQATLLAHELAHYRRRDHLVRWFEVFVLALYWWHPVAWIARRELARAEEQCCDAWVLWALPGRECAYARVILETIDFLASDRRPAPMLATGLGPVHRLERRIEMIVQSRSLRRLPGSARFSLVLVGLLVLPFSTKAQTAAEPAKPAEPSVEAQPAEPSIEARPAVQAVSPVEVSAPTVVEFVDRSASAPVVTAVLAEPSIQPANSNNLEQRLQRLEKLVESIAAEMKNQRVGPTRANSYRTATDYGIASYPTQRVARTPAIPPSAYKATQSLSELKKRRIDIEDQLEDLKESLGEIDHEIAKLQDARPAKRYVDSLKK